MSDYDATVLTEDRSFSDYFEQLTFNAKNYKSAANWMLGPVRSWLNEHNSEIDSFTLQAGTLSILIGLVDDGKLSFSAASSMLLPLLIDEPGSDPLHLAKKHNLLQVSEHESIEPMVDEVLAAFVDKVKEYRKGKKGLLSLFVGEVMKRSKGNADPKVVNEIILQKLKS